MKLTFISLLFLLLASACSHMKSGQYVYWPPGQNMNDFSLAQHLDAAEIKKYNPRPSPGQWIFVPNRIGFLPFLRGTEVMEDYSDLATEKFQSWPVPGHKRISSGFGFRAGRNHDGIDIPAPVGTPIVAVAAGVVKYSNNKISGYGNMIILEHPGKVFSVYAHNSRNMVDEGDKVRKGQVIGKVGNTGRSTGPHLHFEIRIQNKARNPASYLSKNGKKVF